MPHFGTAPIIDRVVALFQQDLNAELALVDAAANARAAAGGPEHSFTTDALPAAALVGYFEDGAIGFDQAVFVLEAEAGRTYLDTLAQSARDGSPANRPRIGTEHALLVRTRCRARRGTWTRTGAYRRCDRIATAEVSLLGRYPDLSTAAPSSLGPLVQRVEVVADRRPSFVEEQDGITWARDLTLRVRTLEDRG